MKHGGSGAHNQTPPEKTSAASLLISFEETTGFPTITTGERRRSGRQDGGSRGV